MYPQCLDITITGDGADEPASDELVSITSTYRQHDPGLWVDNHPALLTDCARPLQKPVLTDQTQFVRDLACSAR